MSAGAQTQPPSRRILPHLSWQFRLFQRMGALRPAPPIRKVIQMNKDQVKGAVKEIGKVSADPQAVTASRAPGHSRFGGHYPELLASLGFAALLSVSVPALAQTVGAAQSFAILGGTAVTANGTGSVINGDVGVAPAAGSAITGFPAAATVVSPYSVHGNDGLAIGARAATLTLYNDLAALGGAIPILPGLSGQNLGPGVYSTGAALLTNGAPLILNGAGIYVFQVSSSLTADVGSNITLVGVNPCNVFWQVTSLATLNGATFTGNVVAQSGVHLGTGATLTGRALAAAGGDVTLAGTNTIGGCSTPAAGSGSVNGVPTLSEWATILLTGLLGIAGIAAIRRKQR
jgi:hypothetical protein